MSIWQSSTGSESHDGQDKQPASQQLSRSSSRQSQGTLAPSMLSVSSAPQERLAARSARVAGVYAASYADLNTSLCCSTRRSSLSLASRFQAFFTTIFSPQLWSPLHTKKLVFRLSPSLQKSLFSQLANAVQTTEPLPGYQHVIANISVSHACLELHIYSRLERLYVVHIKVDAPHPRKHVLLVTMTCQPTALIAPSIPCAPALDAIACCFVPAWDSLMQPAINTVNAITSTIGLRVQDEVRPDTEWKRRGTCCCWQREEQDEYSSDDYDSEEEQEENDSKEQLLGQHQVQEAKAMQIEEGEEHGDGVLGQRSRAELTTSTASDPHTATHTVTPIDIDDVDAGVNQLLQIPSTSGISACVKPRRTQLYTASHSDYAILRRGTGHRKQMAKPSSSSSSPKSQSKGVKTNVSQTLSTKEQRTPRLSTVSASPSVASAVPTLVTTANDETPRPARRSSAWDLKPTAS
eukprot:m.50828 g.50828  ORF g.50828 m.50828 type:complete len:464 (+) comp11192_c0_seq1:200-1591(+)